MELIELRRCLWRELDGEATFKHKELVTAITRQDQLFLWPVANPGPNGRIDRWMPRLTKQQPEQLIPGCGVTANMRKRSYDVLEACATVA